MPTLSDVTGTGLSSPVEFSNSSQKDQLFVLASGEALIHQSILTILMTPIGSRINNPEFGSNIKALLFEPNDAIFFSLFYFQGLSALQRWEKRITVKNIAFATKATNPNDGDFLGSEGDYLVKAVITYMNNLTHQPGSFVFPFVRTVMPFTQLVQGQPINTLVASRG